VQVCPVDIDIRDGLQYECINCGLCVDACDSVMDKMDYPRGLVKFTSEDALETGHTHFFRPRLFGYSFVLMAMIGLFIFALSGREPIAVDVARDRGANLYRIEGDQVVNVYRLTIHNMDRSDHSHDVPVVEGQSTLKQKPVYLEEGEVFTLPIRVQIPKSDVISEQEDIYIEVVSQEDPEIIIQYKTTFIAPMNNSGSAN
jgi:cytochrome c oxidase accessory protein FixG